MDSIIGMVLVSIDLSSLCDCPIGEVCLVCLRSTFNYVGEQQRASCHGAVVGNLNLSSWLSSQLTYALSLGKVTWMGSSATGAQYPLPSNVRHVAGGRLISHFIDNKVIYDIPGQV